jgi:hypothetical protein
VSIYDVLAEHGIQVASVSRPQKIHCPVHDDQHKSAVVYPDSQEIFCFAEDRVYDVVSLTQEWEGLEWWEACAALEAKVGLVYERQAHPEDEFWGLLRQRDDPQVSPRQAYDLRWAIHRSVLELGSGEIDWAEFDALTCALDVGILRRWQRKWVDDVDKLEDSA